MATIQLVPAGVKTKHYTVTLPTELAQRLSQPVKGQGGWQSLIQDLQGHLDSDSLELPESLIHRMVPYAVKFGSGGYQSLIRWILCLVLDQHTIFGVGQSLKGQGGDL